MRSRDWRQNHGFDSVVAKTRSVGNLLKFNAGEGGSQA
jgi:hypothetical protein